jgi:hypothetical protein
MAYTADVSSVPTLAELITGTYVPEIFSKNVIMHTKSNLVVADHVNTDYRKELKVGYTAHIPLMSEVTDADVVPGTAPTPINIVGSPTSITVDQWRVAAVEEHDMAEIQDAVGYLDKAAQSCAYRIAKRVDTALGALFSTCGGSVYGSDGQTLSDDIILALMEYLDEGDVPEDDRCIILDPSSKVDLLKIDKFVRNDYVREPAVPTGKFGNIYNMGVFITNNLTAVGGTGNYAIMMHKDCLGLVIQENPRSQRVVIPQEFRTLYMVDVIYGVGVLRSTFGRPFYTRSA